jgi:hypothetical protein
MKQRKRQQKRQCIVFTVIYHVNSSVRDGIEKPRAYMLSRQPRVHVYYTKNWRSVYFMYM